MKPPPSPRSPMAAVAAIAVSSLLTVLAGCATSPPAPPAKAAATPAVAAVPPALRLEGVPALPQSLLDSARRYNGVAGHGLVDWHPTKRELLVLHRAPGSSTSQLFRLRSPLGELEALTSGSDPVAGARWEPRDGRFVVFARGSGGDEAYQLYRLDPDSRAVTQLTPAGQRHAWLGWIKLRSLVIASSVPLDRTASGGTRSEIKTTLSLIDPMNPAQRQVLAELPGGGWGDVEVSPDESQLAITNYISATQSEIWVLPLKPQSAGALRRVLPAAGDETKASYAVQGWSPDGRSLLVTSDRGAEFMALMRLEPASGALTPFGPPTPWNVEAAELSTDGKYLSVRINADGKSELRLLDAATGQPLKMPLLPDGSVIASRFQPAGAELAFALTGAQGPGRIQTLNLQTAAVTAWTKPSGAEGLDLAALPSQQIVRWTSFDGRTISGVLTLPPARYTGRRPVVMLVHGGPESQATQGWRGRYNHLVQELGVALFEPNVRGSSGFGKTFLSLDDGYKREDSVKDMASAIDWMATQPRLDAGRVLVMGGSYGGYMALAASTRLADRIAGAVATVGISNFVSFLQNTESYRRDLRRVEYGDERDPAMRAFLQEISPLSHVERITKPLFVVQGKNDPRVPWTESEQIVRSLQQRGTPVWYMLADNEGHGFARRENADYAYAATVKFIEETLKP